MPNFKIEREEFTRLWLAGAPIWFLAEYFKVNPLAVRDAGVRYGLRPAPVRKPRPKPVPVQPPRATVLYGEAEALVADGMTYRQALCQLHRARSR